jgi:hypothetical protein
VQRRAAGWQVASGVLLFSAVVQCAGMAIVVCLLPSLLLDPKLANHLLLHYIVASETNISRPSSTTMTRASGTAGTLTPASTSSPRHGQSLSSPLLA